MATIVVADDDPVVVRLLTLILEGEGHSVLRAGDGTAALEYLACGSCDLLIADHVMPHPNGGALVALLRDAPGPRVRTLLISAFATLATLPVAPDAFLAKPFDLDQLLATVGLLLSDPANEA